MKKLMLSLMSATLGCTAFAQSCVSVQQIGTDYTGHQITIALARNGCTGDATNHRNTVWVFVDYREAGGSAWTRATIGAVSAGTVVNSGSSKGAWITGANGTQTVTLTLSGMPEKYDWCAFATDYPPNALSTDMAAYALQGTKPFLVNGTATIHADTYSGTITALTDATGCPGIIAAAVTGGITGANSNAGDLTDVYVLHGSNSIVNATVAECGFVYSSTNTSPSMATGTKLAAATGSGACNYSWTNTTYSTTFYVRAYAITGGKTAYGNVQSFKTWSNWSNSGVYSGYVSYGYYSGNYCSQCLPASTLKTNTTTSQNKWGGSGQCFWWRSSCSSGCDGVCHSGTYILSRQR